MHAFVYLALIVGARYSAGTLNVARYSVSPVQYHIQTDTGGDRYFRYETSNGQFRKEKRLRNGRVVGEYGWTDDRGILRLYDYLADQDGYRVVRERSINVADIGSYDELFGDGNTDHYLVGATGSPPQFRHRSVSQVESEFQKVRSRPNQVEPDVYRLDPLFNKGPLRQNEPKLNSFNRGPSALSSDQQNRGHSVSTVDDQRWFGGSYYGNLNKELSGDINRIVNKRRKNYQKVRNYASTYNEGTFKQTREHPNFVKVDTKKNLERNLQDKLVPPERGEENEVGSDVENDKRDKRRSNFDKIFDAGERRQIARGKKLFPLIEENHKSTKKFVDNSENAHLIKHIHDDRDNVNEQIDVSDKEAVSAGVNRGSSVIGKENIPSNGDTNDYHLSFLDTQNGSEVIGSNDTYYAPASSNDADYEEYIKRVHALHSPSNNALLERDNGVKPAFETQNFESTGGKIGIDHRLRVPMSRQLRARVVTADIPRPYNVGFKTFNPIDNESGFEIEIPATRLQVPERVTNSIDSHLHPSAGMYAFGNSEYLNRSQSSQVNSDGEDSSNPAEESFLYRLLKERSRVARLNFPNSDYGNVQYSNQVTQAAGNNAIDHTSTYFDHEVDPKFPGPHDDTVKQDVTSHRTKPFSFVSPLPNTSFLNYGSEVPVSFDSGVESARKSLRDSSRTETSIPDGLQLPGSLEGNLVPPYGSKTDPESFSAHFPLGASEVETIDSAPSNSDKKSPFDVTGNHKNPKSGFDLTKLDSGGLVNSMTDRSGLIRTKNQGELIRRKRKLVTLPGLSTIHYDTGGTFHFEETGNGGKRTGKHGYVDPFGFLRVASYTSDGSGHVETRTSRHVGTRQPGDPT